MPATLDDLEKRITSLDNKAAIAIAVAAFLGLGGVGIGKFLWDAYKQIDALNTQLNTYKQEIATTKNAALNDIKEAGDVTAKKLKEAKINVGQAKNAATYVSYGPEPWNFWTDKQDTHVDYTCGDNSVLAGINFIMHSDGVGRHPYKVEYFCKNLVP